MPLVMPTQKCDSALSPTRMKKRRRFFYTNRYQKSHAKQPKEPNEFDRGFLISDSTAPCRLWPHFLLNCSYCPWVGVILIFLTKNRCWRIHPAHWRQSKRRKAQIRQLWALICSEFDLFHTFSCLYYISGMNKYENVSVRQFDNEAWTAKI